MRFQRQAARTVATGGLAGLFALALDEALALLTLGFPVPLAPRLVVAYAALGALAALTVAAVSRVRRRRLPSGWTSFAVAAAGVYAPPVFQRVYELFGQRAAPVFAAGAAALAIGAYGLWIAVMAYVAGARARSLAPLLGAAGAATGLAINQNLLLSQPLAPVALATNAAVLAAALALAALGRSRGARRALAVAAALALGAAVIAVAGRRPPAPPAGAGGRAPNLVLVIIDTLRQDTFLEVVRQTEEGRALRAAMDGAAWFSHAIAASPWTVPSVGSIMTGLYPQEHGAVPAADPSRPPRPLGETVPTLAQRLKRRGYWTEAIGSNPFLLPESGIARGFDSYEILSGATVRLPPLTALARLELLRSENYQSAGSVRRRLRQRLGRMTASGRPVFLWLHLMDPHYPLHSHRGLAPDPGAAGLDEMLRLYREEVRYALRELTAMLQLLRTHGLGENTALVVVSDHGEMFPADGHDGVTLDGERPTLYGHGHAMYGELVRVPLVIRPPGGLPATRQVEVLTSHVDLHDTILDLLGVDGARTGHDRVSLAPWLGSEPPESGLRRRFHALIGANSYGPMQRALRTRRHKLIAYPQRRRRSELYLISSDPGELRDVAAARPDLLAEVQQQLDSTWAQLGEAPATGPIELDPETLERLEALGYLP